MDLVIIAAGTALWFGYQIWKRLPKGSTPVVIFPSQGQPSQPLGTCDPDSIECLISTLDPKKDQQLIVGLSLATTLARLPEPVRDIVRGNLQWNSSPPAPKS